jgi:hypothetical protein
VTRNQIREAWEARPFVPFMLHLPDGRTLTVRHPELLSVSVDNRALWVWTHRDAGRMVDAMLVSDIEFLAPRRARRRA